MGKRPDKVKPPRFKKKSNRQSARFARNSFRFKNGVLSLSKIGAIPIVWHRRVSGEPSSVVLSMTPSGRYYVSFQVEQPLPVVGPASHRIAVNMNTKTFNFFNGRRWSQVWLPRPLLAALSKLRTAHKRLSRVTDLRTDFLQKLSTQLIHKNQVIMVETLGTKNILKNRRLARAISDAGFGEFVGMLEYKC